MFLDCVLEILEFLGKFRTTFWNFAPESEEFRTSFWNFAPELRISHLKRDFTPKSEDLHPNQRICTQIRGFRTEFLDFAHRKSISHHSRGFRTCAKLVRTISHKIHFAQYMFISHKFNFAQNIHFVPLNSRKSISYPHFRIQSFRTPNF